jgi:hypothetical protein
LCATAARRCASDAGAEQRCAKQQRPSAVKKSTRWRVRSPRSARRSLPNLYTRAPLSPPSDRLLLSGRASIFSFYSLHLRSG